jgi:hypothetical protein
LSGLIVLAVIVGVVWFAFADRDVAWWQWALAVPAAIIGWIVAGVVVCLLFAGVLWFFFGARTLRKKLELRRILRLAEAGDTAAAAARAQAVCRSSDWDWSDALAPALRERFAQLARGGEELNLACLRLLLEHARWSDDVAAVLEGGVERLSSRELPSWLAWFRRHLPDGPERAERLAVALARVLPRMTEVERRSAWSEVLVLAEDTPAWRELAARYRDDLLAVAAAGEARMPRAREKLALLLRGGDPVTK